MTVQLRSARFGKSKKVLQDMLNTDPMAVYFVDPSFFNPRSFRGDEMVAGERFPVVMDPETRRRFATVARNDDGTFRVT